VVTVLVVDDQAAFRGALRELVAATEGFVLVGEAASGEEALEAVDCARCGGTTGEGEHGRR
jgi:DNA-binding NarL/FixJ family response regulator